MIVVGGTYSEYCYHPEWHQIFGSGGRGAAALTRLGVQDVTLKTSIPRKERRAVKATLSPYGVKIEAVESNALCEFIYTHPLSEPYLKPYPVRPAVYKAAIHTEVALVYGMLEGIPQISAKRIVFDPQSEADASEPFKFIKTTEQLAAVLNEKELASWSRTTDIMEGAKKLISKRGVDVVVVKQGPFGCLVMENESTYSIPVFPSANVFKIGSGGV